MKITAKPIVTALAAFAAITVFQSCLGTNDGNPDYSQLMPSAIVTVKPVVTEDEEYFYLQVNDEEKLWPVENSRIPYDDREVRAFVNFTDTEMPAGVDAEVYSKAVKINWMDSILTKRPVMLEPGLSSAASSYGNDPVEIYADWMTNVEDGYLTLHFYTRMGSSGVRHELNLLSGLNPEDPYEVWFKHNAHGDFDYYNSEGIVAFCLKDLPDTKGEKVKLTLKFDSFSGTKTVKFDYCTREDWQTEEGRTPEEE